MSDSFGGICARVAWLPHSQVRLRSKSLCGSNLVDGPWLSQYRLQFRADRFRVNFVVWVL